MLEQQRIYNFGGEYFTADEYESCLIGEIVLRTLKDNLDGNAPALRRAFSQLLADPACRAELGLEPLAGPADILPIEEIIASIDPEKLGIFGVKLPAALNDA